MSDLFRDRFVEVVAKAKGDRSQAEFAHYLGVSSSAVQKWLAGNGFPSSENLEKIAKAAGFSGVDEMTRYLRGEEFSEDEDRPKIAEEIFPLANHLDKEQRKRLIEMLLKGL
ncbi:helix-turn-helix domain-containing protein [Anabaena sp. CCY 9910]|uniref:helix-turn-helix domain-containing protein n=1 Tax=Anabaena sp. CCY 9910 TaxID=3103870 RepID=UPI0039E112DE